MQSSDDGGDDDDDEEVQVVEKDSQEGIVFDPKSFVFRLVFRI